MKIFTKYYASWCVPCKRMQPIVDELKKEYKDVEFIEKDIDEYKDDVSEFGIRGVPTFIVFEDGTELARKTGMCTKTELEELLRG